VKQLIRIICRMSTVSYAAEHSINSLINLNIGRETRLY